MSVSTRTVAGERPRQEEDSTLRGIGIVLCGAVLIGGMAVCVRIAAQEMAAPQIAFVRFVGSLLVLLLLRNGQSWRPRSGRWSGLVLRGSLGTLAIFLYYVAIAGGGAGFASVLQSTYPVYTALFATRLLGERFDARLGVALLCSIAGGIVIVAPTLRAAPAMGIAGVCGLVAAICSGGAVATARHLRLTEGAFLVTFWFMVVGTVLSAPAMFSGIPALSSRLVFALAGVVFTSIAGQMLLHHGLGFAPATQASLAAATSTVTAVALGTVFLGERLSAWTLVGGGLVLGAVALAAGRRTLRPEPLPPPLP